MAREWLSIDYGTSNTVAVLCREDGRRQPLLFDSSPLLSSAVYAAPDGRVLVGRDAERNARIDPSRFEGNPKRRIDDTEVLLGDRALALDTLIAATLRRVAEEAGRICDTPVGDAVLTHPVAWGPTRRAILTRAAGQAGLNVRALVPEPVAAAAYFTAVLGHHIDEGRSILVYDLGAGTFDATVLQRRDGGFHALAAQGLDDVGGLDLDALVVAHIGTAAESGADAAAWRRLVQPADADDRRDFALLWTDVRQARESLSRESTATVYVPRLGRDVIITREELERAAAPLLHRTVELAAATLVAAGIRPPDLAGCFLVGGTSRTPIVATLLHRAIGVAPTAIEDPQLVVAAGAVHTALPAAPADSFAPERGAVPAVAAAGPAAPAAGSIAAAPVSPAVDALMPPQAPPPGPVSGLRGGPVSGPRGGPVSGPPATPATTGPVTRPNVPPAFPPAAPAVTAPVTRPNVPPAFPPVGAGQAPASPGPRRRGVIIGAAVATAVILVIGTIGAVMLRDKLTEDGGTPSRSATSTATVTSAGAAGTLAGGTGGVRGTPAALAAKPVVGAGTRPLDALTLTTLVEGTGSKVTRGQTATVNYVGASYTTGEEFDSSWSRNQTFEFVVGNGSVIPGFDAAVQGAVIGSRVQADIPADLAYGNDPGSGKPGGPLRFVIDILAAA